MNLLLDTHVFLWWLDDNPMLSVKAKSAIADARNPVFISAASVWELRIKEAIGKLEIPENFYSVIRKEPFEPLDITIEHAHTVGVLPFHHRDPFDRMLVAQCMIEKLTLVTRDALLEKYEIPILKA